MKLITVHIGKQIFAIPISEMSEIFIPEKLIPLPETPNSILGVTPVRGEILPAVSLRALLGMPSAKEESLMVTSEFKKGKTEIELWLKNISISVDNLNRVTDIKKVHQLEFFKWHKNYHSWNRSLARIYAKFEALYLNLQNFEKTVDSLIENNQFKEAQQKIDNFKASTWDDLDQLFSEAMNFAEVQKIWETAVIIEPNVNDTLPFAIFVDAVGEGIDLNLEPLSVFQPLLLGVVKTGQEVISVLNTEQIVNLLFSKINTDIEVGGKSEVAANIKAAA